MEPKSTRAGWSLAVKAIVLPSLAATALAWHFTHSPPITYVALLTTWLFALVGVAAAYGP